MLKLKRYRGQGIYIGNNIFVKVLKIGRDGCVELGISAPNEVKILRSELCHKNNDRKEEAENENSGNS
jgi:carbon storage regulator CsrA